MSLLTKNCKPNLPEGDVKQMLVSAILPPDIVNELEKFGVEVIKLGKCAKINSELAFHPDILTLNYDAGNWLVEKDSIYFPENVNVSLTRINHKLGNKYPADCIFNSFIIDRNVFCGSVSSGLYSNIEELKNHKLITFKQGYTKCSVVIVDENSFITGDKAIHKKLIDLGYDSLYVSNEPVALNGYKNGFIGGCAGKLSKNLLAFTGNIKMHPQYENIKAFCKNKDVDIYSLRDSQLYDFGSLLPVNEAI